MKQKTVEHYPDYWNKYVSDDKYEAKVISELRGLEKLTLPLNTFLNKNKIPKNESYVYKISVGGKDFIGCTNKYYFENEEHRFHNLAKTNSKHPLCVALRRYGFVSKCILISKHNDEVTALLAQISEIEKLKPKLNETIGGEGVNYNIIEQYDENGELILFIEDKLKIKNIKKYARLFEETCS